MGASVKMMQKQVDLSYNNIEAIQKTLSAQEQVTAETVVQGNGLQGLNDAQKEQAQIIIKNTLNTAKQADTQSGVTSAIDSGLKGLKELGLTDRQRQMVQTTLNQGVGTYNELQTKSLAAQKKIYDLTKDVREGYLDAIREMSFGAGEFEKIIGTQDMGVTQLMASVKDVTGEQKLNTMALGGITDTNTAAGKARTGGFAKYGAGGLDFGQITGKAQEDMNTDIHGYQDSINKVNSQGKGEGPTPTAGMDGNNSEHMDNVRAVQDTTDAIHGLGNNMPTAVETGLKNWSRGLNAGLQPGGKGAPGQEKGTLQDAINRTSTFGAGQARNAVGQSGGPARTNTESGTLVNHGTLPLGVNTDPKDYNFNMKMAKKLRDKKDKNLIALDKEYDMMMAGWTLAVEGNKSQVEINKNKAKTEKAAGKIRDYVSKAVALEKQNLAEQSKGKGVKDAGGTTFFGTDASAWVGEGKTPAKAKPQTPEQIAVENDKKAQAAEAKAKANSLQDLNKAFYSALNKAGLATNIKSKTKFEKEAGAILGEIKGLDKNMAKSIATGLTSKVAKNIEGGENVDLKSELSSLQNIVGKGVTQALSKSLSSEKSKALEKAAMVENKKEPTHQYDKLAESDTIATMSKLMNPIDTGKDLLKGLDKWWFGKPDEKEPSKIYSSDEKAMRLGRAQNIANGKDDIEGKTLAVLQELTGKDAGDIEYTDVAQFSDEMKNFFKSEKVGPKETKKILESINLGGNVEGSDVQSKLMSKMKRNVKQDAQSRETEVKARAEGKPKGGKDKYDMIADMFGGIAARSGIDLKKQTDLARDAVTHRDVREKDNAEQAKKREANKSGTMSLEDTRAGIKSGKITEAQGVLGMNTKDLLGLVQKNKANKAQKEIDDRELFAPQKEMDDRELFADTPIKTNKEKSEAKNAEYRAKVKKDNQMKYGGVLDEYRTGQSSRDLKHTISDKTAELEEKKAFRDKHKYTDSALNEGDSRTDQQKQSLALKSKYGGQGMLKKNKDGTSTWMKRGDIDVQKNDNWFGQVGEEAHTMEMAKGRSRGKGKGGAGGGSGGAGGSKEAEAFMKSMSGDVQIGKGETAAEAFERTAFNKGGAGGNQIWTGSSGDMAKHMKKSKAAAKMFQKQQDAKKKGKGKGLGGESGQTKGASKEKENQASEEVQAEFTSQEAQANRELSGLGDGGGGGGSGGGGGGATIVIKLEGSIQGQIESLDALKVQLENV
jgi:hypothetical protein